MASCDWAMFCDYAFWDQGTKICLIGVFDRIFASAVPAHHNRAALAFSVVGEPNEKVRVAIDLLRPGEVGGGQLFRAEAQGSLGELGSAQFALPLMNMLLPDYGTYTCRIRVNDDDVASKSIALAVTRPLARP